MEKTMKKIILAALTVLTLGAGAANAGVANNHSPSQQQGNNYNFMEGGGG
jgi:hypothetical protein